MFPSPFRIWLCIRRYLLNLNLCCKCFDRLMDKLVPKCETNPLPDPYAELAAAYAEDLQGR
ncbi:MAG: hypothetical protein KH354_03075 [Clostridiales bacterium]|nr:hypothetical protein [Clostridiales bacterium]